MKELEAEEQIDYVRKVLGIVSVQMALTFILAAASANFKSMGLFFKNPFVLVFAAILTVACFIALWCDKGCRREVPKNYLLLGAFTIGEASTLAAVAADLSVFGVFTAILATCITVSGLFVAAMYLSSTVDRDLVLRTMAKGLFVAFFLNLFMLLVIVFMYNPGDKAAVIGISCAMCLISGAYIMFSLFFIIVPGIEDKDDYIIGALRLYVHIADLFYWMM